MSDTSEEGGSQASSRTTDTDEVPGGPHASRGASEPSETTDPITQPVGVDDPEEAELDDTDVLGGQPADTDDDTDVLGAKPADSDSDTDVLDPSAADLSETDPTRTVPAHERPSIRELEAPIGWESFGELDGALPDALGGEGAHSDRTLELDAVYSRGRLRRAARETGEGEGAAEHLDPFEVTGLTISYGDAGGSSSLGEAPSTGRFEKPPTTGRTDSLEKPRDWSGSISVGLDAVDAQVTLEKPWAQLFEELRQETLAESDPKLRSGYVFLLANLLALFGGVGREAAERLEEAGAQTSHPVRTLLVDLIVKHWDAPDERFLDALDRLETWDETEQIDAAGVRRAAIVVERLLAGGLDAETEQRLEQRLSPPETLPGLVLRAIRAHQDGHQPRAAQIWRQVSRHLREEPHAVLVDVAAYFLRGTPGFFDYLQRQLTSGNTPRTLLVMMQREAAACGDHLREAVALRHLVAADVALGRRLENDSAPRRARLKDIAAARFFRLSTLLRGLGRSRKTDSTLANLEPHKVVRDAVALAPRHPLYLRRLTRWSRARGDLNNCAKSLATLATTYADRRMRALALAELARTIFIGRGTPELVEQYLDQALDQDPRCAPARLSKAYRLIGEENDAALTSLQAMAADEAIGVDFPDDEHELIRQQAWGNLARLLEQKLESAVDSEHWESLTFRIAHVHGWYLSPAGDTRLRAEFLEQVLIANADHLPALVEILDVRLARREYLEASEVLERLAELAAEPADRTSWLTELAVLAEHYLGTPDWAFDCFREALELAPGDVDAFFGLLRTDSASSESAVDGIVGRLDAGVAVREGDELALELALRVDEAPAAVDALDERFPDQPFWQFVRMCTCADEAGDGSAAVETLRRMWTHPSVAPVLDVFEQYFAGVAEVSPAELRRRLNAIKASPLGEGRLLRSMHEARRLHDPELQGMLAAIRSRRIPEAVSRATDLAWMGITLLWRDEKKQALTVCEHILERFPDFLPALKLAKITSERLARWADLVRWCEREAERTCVSQVAFENRAMASEVQRKYLGDFDAACQQFRTVLDNDPGHREAFDKLKPLLLQRGEVDELLSLYERRVTQTPALADKCAMLNEMADIALHRGKNRAAAIEYFQRSLDLEPDQLRSLRILAELYHEDDQLDAALRRYQQAAELTDNDTLLERLWVQIGELLEEAERDLEALEAYERALRINPSQTEIVLEVARLEATTGGLETALIHLQRLESTASNPEVLREGRAMKARYLVELGRDESRVLSAYRELLVNHPEDLESVDALCDYMGGAESDEVVEFFRSIAFQSFQEMQGRPFEPHFAIARRLGHADRAFCLAAVANTLGHGTREMEEFYRQHSTPRRWPTRGLPEKLVGELVPHPLLDPFLGLLRQSEPAVRQALGQAMAGAALERATPLEGGADTPVELARRWPALFGLEVREVLEVPEIDGGSLVCSDGGLCLVLDQRWRTAADPTELLVHLGKQLAGWWLGIGAWQFLDTQTRFVALLKLVSHLAPGWGGAVAGRPTPGLDWASVEAWLERHGAEKLEGHARELSGRLSTQAVEPQFRMVELTLERAGCLVLDDPGRYFPHTKYLGSEHGLLQQPWSFVFTKIAADMRRHCGVAQPPGPIL